MELRRVNGFDVYAVRPRSAGETGVPARGPAALVPIYGLAPQHHGLEALDLVIRVIEELSDEGRPSYLVGDSAGGGLALAVAQAMAERAPGSVIGSTLIAPWLDLRMGNPAIAEIEPHDPWLARAGLRPMAVAWSDGRPLDDPRLSSLFGAMAGLAHVQFLVGTRDIALSDCRVLRDQLSAAGALTYHEEPGALHCLPVAPRPGGGTGTRCPRRAPPRRLLPHWRSARPRVNRRRTADFAGTVASAVDVPLTLDCMTMSEHDLTHLRRCVALAREALADGDEPFGSVLVDSTGKVRFEDRNRVKGGDHTRHPEIEIARWAAAHLTPQERSASTVYTSGEHCPMCAAAHAWVGLDRIVYAASSAQLAGWLDEWGAPASPVAPLPIQTVAPGVPVEGPVPELVGEVEALYRRCFVR